MPAYKGMYLSLFNATTKAIEQLQQAQLETENKFIEQQKDNQEKTLHFTPKQNE